MLAANGKQDRQTQHYYALLAAPCQISGLYDEKHPTALANNAVRAYYWNRFMIVE